MPHIFFFLQGEFSQTPPLPASDWVRAMVGTKVRQGAVANQKQAREGGSLHIAAAEKKKITGSTFEFDRCDGQEGLSNQLPSLFVVHVFTFEMWSKFH